MDNVAGTTYYEYTIHPESETRENFIFHINVTNSFKPSLVPLTRTLDVMFRL
jgi:hypothetical protein